MISKYQFWRKFKVSQSGLRLTNGLHTPPTRKTHSTLFNQRFSLNLKLWSQFKVAFGNWAMKKENWKANCLTILCRISKNWFQMATKLEYTHLDRFKLKNCSLNIASMEILQNYLGTGYVGYIFWWWCHIIDVSSVQTVTGEKPPFWHNYSRK